MTGAAWSGREMCWRHAPQDYGAIHFQEDDLYDWAWTPDLQATLPSDLPSGVYGVRLREADQLYIMPLFVSPSLGQASSAIAYLAPTLTYTAYANHARAPSDGAYAARQDDWACAVGNPADHPKYGLSTYHHHRDGSGVGYASTQRPNLSLRPGFLDFVEPKGSGARHFAAGCHITTWLAGGEHGFDVLTDQALHAQGVDLLAPYKVLVTSTHPEHYTEAMWRGLQAYVAAGGRLVYLGGNGFYWKVVANAANDQLFEIRRSEGGIRLWATEPGEAFHAFDGSYGGLWRRQGRAPQRLAGVGFSAQGPFEGSYYRRTQASFDPKFAWMFDGVQGEVFGNSGFCGGGAAGYELDRADVRPGTAPDATVVARSEALGPGFVAAPEEWLSHLVTNTGEPQSSLIRADMTNQTNAAGGAIFSTGSITFAGALLHNKGRNPVSQLLDNVLRHFVGRHLADTHHS